MKNVQKTINLYSLFQIFGEPLFWGPILITSLQHLAGMELHDIYFQEAVVIVICVLLDIPAGALADVIGRKKTLIIGQCFLLGSITGFALMFTPVHAWIANILWAIGISFQSGSDNSLLYESLSSVGRESECKRIQGRAISWRLLLIGISSLAVGPLVHIHPRLPMLLSIPFCLIPFTIAFLFDESAIVQKYSVKSQFEIIKMGLKYVRGKKEVRWIIGFSALIMGSSKIWFFTYNPYFELVHIKIEHYGFIFFLLNLVAWLFSRYATEVEQKFGEKNCVWLMILFIGVPVMLMGSIPMWPLAYFVLFQNIVRGFMMPFTNDFMNRHLSSDIRVTVLSMRSSMSNFISIFTLSTFGAILKTSGVLISLQILGTMVLLIGAVSFRQYLKLFRKE